MTFYTTRVFIQSRSYAQALGMISSSFPLTPCTCRVRRNLGNREHGQTSHSLIVYKILHVVFLLCFISLATACMNHRQYVSLSLLITTAAAAPSEAYINKSSPVWVVSVVNLRFALAPRFGKCSSC